MTETKIEAALNICNILPVHLFEETINILSKIDKNLTNNILINKEGPIEIKYDEKEKKFFLGNVYNKEKNSHRSPYSNIYYPEHFPNSYIPSEPLRSLEILYNDIFDNYRKTYYIDGLSSVYLWPNPVEDGFVACFLIKKKENYDKNISLTWESIHLIQANITYLAIHYQISSTLNISIKKENEILLTCSINKALENPKKISDVNLIKNKYFHLTNIGKMIEGIENSLRKSTEYIYLSKINDIFNSLRYNDLFYGNEQVEKQMECTNGVNDHLYLQKESIQEELKQKFKDRQIGPTTEYLFNA
ncbi:F-actin-capping protein subunit beta, putative [Hepatocystis sp. ex Piliocolobus tephrosceles]|nr:F-actin-capping protein subunit beta, putative [Hepatocystis sp. ex Piliocolobus tephrosceles]